MATPVAEHLFELDEDGSLHLLGGFSTTSGQYHFPVAATCPYSGADDVEKVRLSSAGRLVGFTEVTVAPPGYLGEVPYGFGIVELTEERLRVVGRIVGAPLSALDFGLPMRVVGGVVYRDAAGDGIVTWAFTPEGP